MSAAPSPAAERFLSCDWGTSNLRLRYVETAAGNVLAEYAAPWGIRATHEAWKASATERTSFYLDRLAEALVRLERSTGEAIRSAPLLISGMASSSLGIVELPYARLPFCLSGTGAEFRILERPVREGVTAVLISGVRAELDVMRGEETELIGLWQRLPPSSGSSVFLMPGTHSKHALVENGQLRAFTTYMTGEMFEAAARHTVLRDSVEPSPPTPELLPVFLEGVRAGAREPLLHALFTVRTRALLGGRDRPSGYWYLSGLTIGSELAAMVRTEADRIVVCARGVLGMLYRAALSELGLDARLQSPQEEVLDRAAALGHRVLLDTVLGTPGSRARG